MLDNFTESLIKVINSAVFSAQDNKNPKVEDIHVMSQLVESNNSPIVRIIDGMGASLDNIRNEIKLEIEKLPVVSNAPENMSGSAQFNRTLHNADKIAKEFGDSFVSLEIFFLALLENKNSPVAKIFEKENLSYKKVKEHIKKIHKGRTVDSKNYTSDDWESLKKYCQDITALAEEGKIDPIIGRHEEIRRVIQVLQRRTKNNPVLIGKPGVGKTAVIEGLAQRIVNREVPDSLLNKRVLSLDFGSLIAGASYQGEFEKRLKNVLNEVKKEEGRIILFIDEMHIMVGAGKTQGAMDASNLLKPYLARGELHCVGATTLNEYREYIEKDSALERRFQKVMVDEPTVEDTIAILRGLKERYEIHHNVQITDAALISAAVLSDRYITDRTLPDKAIDLVDEAASRLRIEMDSRPEKMDLLYREIIQLKVNEQALLKEEDEGSKIRLAKLVEKLSAKEKEFSSLEETLNNERELFKGSKTYKEELEKLRHELAVAERNGEYTRAGEIQYKLIPDLERKIQQLENDFDSKDYTFTLIRTKVTEQEIAEVVSMATGIPVSKMNKGEREKLLVLEDDLHKRVIGQDEAIISVSDAIRRSRSGISDPNRPYGSFLFLGPTGVGKTELAKTLAQLLFDSEDNMIRLDMSEYMEKHSVSKLIGAPPGYIGYEKGGDLTEAVRRKPYSVVLLDEVEKAHPDVFNVMLQVLDEGSLTDSLGRKVDFKNTIVIMTSNIGSLDLLNNEISQEEKVKIVNEKLKDFFRPELLNRIDDTILFHGLSHENILSIANIQLGNLKKRLEKQNIEIEFSKESVDYLSDLGYDPDFGARPLKRVITDYIENQLARKIISSEIKPNDKVFVSLDENNISFIVN